jgi:hypothetical protein
MTQAELRKAVKRFLADPTRVVSQNLLADAAGISLATFRDAFIDDLPMSEVTQIRMTKALEHLRKGDLQVVRNRNKTKDIVYRKDPKPDLGRSMGLTVQGGQIRLKVGVRNLNDYREPSFKEKLGK